MLCLSGDIMGQGKFTKDILHYFMEKKGYTAEQIAEVTSSSTDHILSVINGQENFKPEDINNYVSTQKIYFWKFLIDAVDLECLPPETRDRVLFCQEMYEKLNLKKDKKDDMQKLSNHSDIQIEELILGCECFCAKHIMRLDYFPHIHEEISEEDDVIYVSLPVENNYSSILPPFNFYSTDWKSFFRFNYLKRLYYAFLYVLNFKRQRDTWQGLTTFEMRLSKVDEFHKFLSLLSSEEIEVDTGFEMELNNDYGDYGLFFSLERLIPGDMDFDYYFFTDVILRPHTTFLKRVRTALKYIFGNISDEVNLSISKKEASLLKGAISCLKKVNKDERQQGG